MKRITMLLQANAAEEATGIKENPSGIGNIYADTGKEISLKNARKLLRQGMPIEIPNSGAGTYQKVFCEILGYDEIKPVNLSSSAGDWDFAIREGDIWRMASQNNRYPYYGFRYCINEHDEFLSFEELVKFE